MGLTGKRAWVADLKEDRQATIIYYSVDCEFAHIRFDGDEDTFWVHRTRVHDLIR